MKLLPTLLLNVAVVALGLFVYDRFITTEDPLSDEALAKLDQQMKELRAKRPPSRQRDARMTRVAQLVGEMDLGLDAAGTEQLLDLLSRNFEDRQAFIERKDLEAMDAKAFERAYRNVIEPHMNRVRILIRNPAKAEAVIKRFIYDGRPIHKPDLTKKPAVIEKR